MQQRQTANYAATLRCRRNASNLVLPLLRLLDLHLRPAACLAGLAGDAAAESSATWPTCASSTTADALAAARTLYFPM